MKAMILAAGVGSRLDPLTRNVPKPMVPIVNKPVIEHIIDKLKKHNFDEIMINLHYLGDVIQSHLDDGSQLGVKIHYSPEDQLWGDAGSCKRVQDFFGQDTFLVLGGDDISEINLTEVVEFHKARKSVATMALTLVDDPSEYGIVLTNEDGRITKFLEKPKGQVVFSKTANTGVYVFEPEVFDIIPEGRQFGFGNDVFPKLLVEGKPMYGIVTTEFWKDVGNLQIYRQTNFDALNGTVNLNVPGSISESGARVGPGSTIDPSVQITPPVLIGSNVNIAANCTLMANTIIADDCVIEADCTLSSTILWRGARVRSGTLLERCTVGEHAEVQSNYGIFDGVVMNPTRRG